MEPTRREEEYFGAMRQKKLHFQYHPKRGGILCSPNSNQPFDFRQHNSAVRI